jgi:hypothetical protein
LFDFSHSAMFQLAFEICTWKKSFLPMQSNCMRPAPLHVGDLRSCLIQNPRRCCSLLLS